MLRIVDAGVVGAARSQALWHGIADAMTAGDAPVLSLCRPATPYVCLGYHGRIDEIDGEACRHAGVAVLRRQVGGGPVWIDADQLFFQITMPWQDAPARVDQLYAKLLAPAVDAFRAIGLPALLRGVNDIAIGDRKISGTGAGRIGDGVTVVGNLLYRFPHDRMAAILALPSEHARAECLRLMHQRVGSVEAEGAARPSDHAAKQALVDAYARRLGRTAVASTLTPAEQAAVASWETRVADPAWVAGSALPRAPLRQVKICADVFVVVGTVGELVVEASLVDGQIDRVRIDGAREIAYAATGHSLAALPAALAEFGADGARVVELLSLARRHA